MLEILAQGVASQTLPPGYPAEASDASAEAIRLTQELINSPENPYTCGRGGPSSPSAETEPKTGEAAAEQQPGSNEQRIDNGDNTDLLLNTVEIIHDCLIDPMAA